MTGTALLSRGFASLRSRRSLRAAREAADAEILRSPAPSLRVAWRAAELVVPRRRFDLAQTLRRVVAEADARHLPNAAPINRAAVRVAAQPLLDLASWLDDLERPVTARGVLLLELLVADSMSPLFEHEPAGALLERLAEAGAALEPAR
jgi:hypothetical protein